MATRKQNVHSLPIFNDYTYKQWMKETEVKLQQVNTHFNKINIEQLEHILINIWVFDDYQLPKINSRFLNIP